MFITLSILGTPLTRCGVQWQLVLKEKKHSEAARAAAAMASARPGAAAEDDEDDMDSVDAYEYAEYEALLEKLYSALRVGLTCP